MSDSRIPGDPYPAVPPPPPNAPPTFSAPASGPGAARPAQQDESTATTVGDRLHAMLQTAVDDQVAEQRQLAQLLADVRDALADRSGQEHTDLQVADLGRRLTETQAALDAIRIRLEEAPLAHADPQAPTVQDLHDGMAGVRTDLRGLPEQIGPAVAQAVGFGLTDVGRTLERLQDEQQTTRHDLAGLQTELAALAPRIEALGPRLDALPQIATALALLGERTRSLEQLPVHQGPDAAEIAGIVRAGVRDATRDFVRDYLRAAVQDIVTVSTRDTERRITDHVDEAVLALAQALLQRRPALSGGGDAVAGDPSRPTARPADPVPPAVPSSGAADSGSAAAAEPEIPFTSWRDPSPQAAVAESASASPADAATSPTAAPPAEAVEDALGAVEDATAAGQVPPAATPPVATSPATPPATETEPAGPPMSPPVSPAWAAPASHRRRWFRRR
ncbi:MAG TPA: hypothetical protein VHC41_03980 [Mycobacteriales bacterium]|nr:hypothetical protein [Mycobacteriales bacterium]